MRILNFGSLNLDHVYSVDHFVRAGETLASLSVSEHLGGKGLNQSVALARAGSEVFHAGKIGTDGAALTERLRAEHVNVDHLKVDGGTPTGHAVIQVDQRGQNCILLFGGANRTVTEADADEVLSHFGKDDLILLQNEITNIEYIIEQAHKKGLVIALNPSPIDNALVSMKALHYVDWFIMNEIEGGALTGKKLGDEILEEMLRRYPESHVALTLGRLGAMYLDKKNFAKHGIYDVPVVDTTAAGDTFTGYFLTLVSENRTAAEALELASKASSLAVTRAGAADSIPDRKEVEGTKIKLDASFL